MPNKDIKDNKNKSILQQVLEGDAISIQDIPKKFLSNRTLANTSIGSESNSKDDIEIIPIGTKVKSFSGEMVKNNYMVALIVLASTEICPLYKLSSRYINEDTESLDIRYYNNISDKFFTTEKIPKKWVAKGKAKAMLFNKDISVEGIESILEDDEFLQLNTLVYLKMESLNSKLILREITEIRIDEDLSVYYKLNGISDTYFTHVDFYISVKHLGDAIFTDEFVPDKEDEDMIPKIVKYLKIEI